MPQFKRYRKKAPLRRKKVYKKRISKPMELATNRPKTKTLKFVKNMTYKINPSLTSDGDAQMYHLQFRANSIVDICSYYTPTQSIHDQEWLEQDEEYALVGDHYNPAFNADGYTEWEDRFQDFTVLGSKISITYQPVLDNTGAGSSVPIRAPTTIYLQKAFQPENGVTPAFDHSGELVKLPYMKRKQILASRVGRLGKGGTLTQSFSPKRDFKITDIMDNQQLSGKMNDANALDSIPSEQAYYNIYLAQTVKDHVGDADSEPMIPGFLRIKLEYITKLTDPTQTNQVSNV